MDANSSRARSPLPPARIYGLLKCVLVFLKCGFLKCVCEDIYGWGASARGSPAGRCPGPTMYLWSLKCIYGLLQRIYVQLRADVWPPKMHVWPPKMHLRRSKMHFRRGSSSQRLSCAAEMHAWPLKMFSRIYPAKMV